MRKPQSPKEKSSTASPADQSSPQQDCPNTPPPGPEFNPSEHAARTMEHYRWRANRDFKDREAAIAAEVRLLLNDGSMYDFIFHQNWLLAEWFEFCQDHKKYKDFSDVTAIGFHSTRLVSFLAALQEIISGERAGL